jgi:CBS-domain-containing membrane protein
MKVSDVMVHNVLAMRPEAVVSEAAKLLCENDISALPVVDKQDDLIGIIWEANLMRREEIGTETRPGWLEAVMPATILANEFAHSHGAKVEDAMSKHVVTARADASLAEIATLLEKTP